MVMMVYNRGIQLEILPPLFPVYFSAVLKVKVQKAPKNIFKKQNKKMHSERGKTAPPLPSPSP